MPETELAKLPPEERLRRLKELEKQHKKELEEAEQQIKNSQRELANKQKWLEKIPIPELAKEDLDWLSEEGRQILRERRGIKKKGEREEESKSGESGEEEEGEESAGKKSRAKKSSLEETLAREQSGTASEAQARGVQAEYGAAGAGQFGSPYRSFQEMSTQEVQQTVYQALQAIEERGYVTRQDFLVAHYAKADLERRMEAVQEGNYQWSAEVAAAASLIQKHAGEISSLYKRKNVERVDHEYKLG